MFYEVSLSTRLCYLTTTSCYPAQAIFRACGQWLLDSPRLSASITKHLAGRLLKQPAREGVVAAQSRLGQLMCRECGNARDRRIGQDLLRQAARAGDRRAQQELELIAD